MGLSKESRIKFYIVVCFVFFLLELAIGYIAHSLALVADSFHMLNDVLSLFVGLWAVKVATQKPSSKEFTYGWARAEIIGGLVNGVALVALCLSIFLEAIQRIFEPQEVSKPKLVLVVGSVGLAFNLLGLLIFHQHDHGHGHEKSDELGSAEEGHAHHQLEGAVDEEEDKNVTKSDTRESETPSDATTSSYRPTAIKWSENGGDVDSTTSSRVHRFNSIASRGSTHSTIRRSKPRGYSIDDLPIHPASLRNDIISQARGVEDEDEESLASESEQASPTEEASLNQDQVDETTALLSSNGNNVGSKYTTDNDNSNVFAKTKPPSHSRTTSRKRSNSHISISHSGHKHRDPNRSSVASSSGHHHDANLRGLFLHVLGDALGNIGVIASALIIWLTTSPYRYYSDPIISLVITVIILKSALPLCRETARPLLQAVPQGLDIDEIKSDLSSLPGVRNVHHLHVWSLTPNKRIATLDVELDFAFDQRRWMSVGREMKRCLHEWGVHSSTLQPEFITEAQADAHGINGTSNENGGLMCGMECGEGQEEGLKCCPRDEDDKKSSGTVTPNTRSVSSSDDGNHGGKSQKKSGR